MHNVRVWHLEKRAKDLADGLTVFETKEVHTRQQVRDAFEASGGAILLTLKASGETMGRSASMPPGAGTRCDQDRPRPSLLTSL